MWEAEKTKLLDHIKQDLYTFFKICVKGSKIA